MMKVFILFWFTISADNRTDMATSSHVSLEKCQAAAQVVLEGSKKALAEGALSSFGGMCKEVSVWSNSI